MTYLLPLLQLCWPPALPFHQHHQLGFLDDPTVEPEALATFNVY